MKRSFCNLSSRCLCFPLHCRQSLQRKKKKPSDTFSSWWLRCSNSRAPWEACVRAVPNWIFWSFLRRRMWAALLRLFSVQFFLFVCLFSWTLRLLCSAAVPFCFLWKRGLLRKKKWRHWRPKCLRVSAAHAFFVPRLFVGEKKGPFPFVSAERPLRRPLVFRLGGSGKRVSAEFDRNKAQTKRVFWRRCLRRSVSILCECQSKRAPHESLQLDFGDVFFLGKKRLSDLSQALALSRERLRSVRTPPLRDGCLVSARKSERRNFSEASEEDRDCAGLRFLGSSSRRARKKSFDLRSSQVSDTKHLYGSSGGRGTSASLLDICRPFRMEFIGGKGDVPFCTRAEEKLFCAGSVDYTSNIKKQKEADLPLWQERGDPKKYSAMAQMWSALVLRRTAWEAQMRCLSSFCGLLVDVRVSEYYGLRRRLLCVG